MIGTVVVVLLGAVVVVVLFGTVVVLFGAVVVVLLGTVVVADLGAVVLVLSLGAVVLVVPLEATVVVVTVAEGTVVVVAFAGGIVVDVSLPAVPGLPEAIEFPFDPAADVVVVTKVEVVFDGPVVPLAPKAGDPGVAGAAPVDCDDVSLVAPCVAESVRSDATTTAVVPGG